MFVIRKIPKKPIVPIRNVTDTELFLYKKNRIIRNIRENITKSELRNFSSKNFEKFSVSLEEQDTKNK